MNDNKLANAIRRSRVFLRVAPESEGRRAVHFVQSISAIEFAAEHAVLAGNDALAMKLHALASDAQAAFSDAVRAPELAHLDAEIAECDRLLANKPRRRLKSRKSPGACARSKLAKRGVHV
ncbi:hypothetical protein [Sphingomonas sanguinis]|jgi:hypothetical protein|uniref:Uncharacterized protein n=1 Tax=Sphingomonas sanguinis TaxID=33051 RepID=A0A7Y7QUR7_9SPHN|nr:hypothetical protein [Sphingomonas sanguinis]MBZ6381121.1 hypothetical protein [Sphingomonas sanguinis]NNG51275.1 hypothetical protein [Sphingomonas sanguinis]NNG55225.1 hypothetical protein [Sphingomonas sanguinis]NVP30423.1 hypothetical protein [Sphingomonas sanguinis]